MEQHTNILKEQSDIIMIRLFTIRIRLVRTHGTQAQRKALLDSYWTLVLRKIYWTDHDPASRYLKQDSSRRWTHSLGSPSQQKSHVHGEDARQ
jgi:hypothetical protein